MVSFTNLFKSLSVIVVLAGLTCALVLASGRAAPALKSPVPSPGVDEPRATSPSKETMVVAGGCFWGVQAVYAQVKGVISATSGYAGGARPADYEMVSTGQTGHAESVKVVYDPSRISYGQLLKIFFSVAHDPTQLNRQGPDSGTQYRSAIFTTSDEQKKVADAYIAQLNAAKVYKKPIVTKIGPLEAFFPAEAYHQDYLTLHPNQPYIAFNDIPKVENLKKIFADNYIEKPTLVSAAKVTN